MKFSVTSFTIAFAFFAQTLATPSPQVSSIVIHCDTPLAQSDSSAVAQSLQRPAEPTPFSVFNFRVNPAAGQVIWIFGIRSPESTITMKLVVTSSGLTFVFFIQALASPAPQATPIVIHCGTTALKLAPPTFSISIPYVRGFLSAHDNEADILIVFYSIGPPDFNCCGPISLTTGGVMRLVSCNSTIVIQGSITARILQKQDIPRQNNAFPVGEIAIGILGPFLRFHLRYPKSISISQSARPDMKFSLAMVALTTSLTFLLQASATPTPQGGHPIFHFVKLNITPSKSQGPSCPIGATCCAPFIPGIGGLCNTGPGPCPQAL
ncbi:hypothetical protein GALMADRAFT_282093 [Galerina marginata CBS 339.88]|uniref:Hydrophobin n=1 Tax=Galerina marginata (strain CBS 339.88) TaxID=685588 RepID=A0A067SJC5_GALM3|nr:hypothetical protein GALMADRAFT_282093 [Galerina marginata CBS 339.88]